MLGETRNNARLHILSDVISIIISFLLAYFLKFESELFEYEWSITFKQYIFSLVLIIPTYIIIYYFFRLYVSKRTYGRRVEFANLVKANITGLLGFILILYLLRQEHFSRTMLFIFFILNIVISTIFRNVIGYILKSMRRRGYNVKKILLIGYSRATEEYINRVNSNPQWGYKICGILDDNIERGTEYRGVKVIGCIDNLFLILSQNELEEIAITLGLREYGKLEYIAGMCEKSGVHTKFIPDYNNIIPTKPYTEDLMGLPIINIRHVPLHAAFNKMVKRTEDIIGSLIAIIVFSPVMIITAIAIKLTSKGPLIFKQTRVGLHNKEFQMYKFRSMKVQTEEEEKKGWTTKDDPRVTKVGKFIRKTSIDELPQFFNVLIGDMSIVGPRPERPQFVEKFKEDIPRYMVKHQVRPGLTGWAQVNGYRGDTSIKRRIECDLYYIENWNIGFDFKIMFLTVFKGFVNKNAY